MDQLSQQVTDGIVNYFPEYPAEHKNLGFDLFKLKEFHDLILENDEQTNPNPGTPLLHQKLGTRMFSPVSPYRSAVFYHAVGTGKTCLVSFIFEYYRKMYQQITSNTDFTPALVIVPNKQLANNFISDISTKCTNGVYVPKSKTKTGQFVLPKAGGLTSKQKRFQEIAAQVRKSYEITTVGSFANEIRAMMSDAKTRQQFIEKYSNRKIVIDEAHNLTRSPVLYNTYHEFLHTIVGCNVFLLTATPMWDDVSEIAALMNFINEPSKQLPLGQEFKRMFFSLDNDVLTLIPDKIDLLKTYFYNKISFLRSLTSNMRKIEIGYQINHPEIFPPHTPLYFNILSRQHANYIKNYSTVKRKPIRNTKRTSDEQPDKPENTQKDTIIDPARKGELDAINFMFLDNTPNQKWCKNCEKSDDGVCLRFFHNHIVITERKTYRYKQDGLGEYIIEHLDIFSSKFASIVKSIKNNPTENVFVYNELVGEISGYGGGGGIINLGLILKSAGLDWLTPNDVKNVKSNPRKRRFAVVSSYDGTYNDTTSRNVLLDKNYGKYNIPENKYGDICQVVIGSVAISTGINLYNTRQMHICSAHWNLSGNDQSEGRPDRYGAHDALPIDERYLKIYHHVSVFPRESTSESWITTVDDGTANGESGADDVVYGYPSGGQFDLATNIDIRVYYDGIEKYFPMAQMRRVIKESSYDCAFNYKRNVLQNDRNNTRECDFQDCNYTCDGFPESNIIKDDKIWKYVLTDKDELDTVTFTSFYSDELKLYYETKTRKYFASSDSINEVLLTVLLFEQGKTDGAVSGTDITAMSQQKTATFHKSIITKSINGLINDYIPLQNRYGLECYLKRKKNMLYLSYEKYQNRIGNIENTKHIRCKFDIDLPESIRQKEISKTRKYIDGICSHHGFDDFKNQFHKFPESLAVELAEVILSDPSYKSLEIYSFIRDRYKNAIFDYTNKETSDTGVFHVINVDQDTIGRLLHEGFLLSRSDYQEQVLRQMRAYLRAERIKIPIVSSEDRDYHKKTYGNDFKLLYDKYLHEIQRNINENNAPDPMPDVLKYQTTSPIRLIIYGRDKTFKNIDDRQIERLSIEIMKEPSHDKPQTEISKNISETEIYGIVNEQNKFWIKLPQVEGKNQMTGQVCVTTPLKELYAIMGNSDIYATPSENTYNSNFQLTNEELISKIRQQGGVLLDYLRITLERYHVDQTTLHDRLISVLAVLQDGLQKHQICSVIRNALASRGKILEVQQSKPVKRVVKPVKQPKPKGRPRKQL